MTLAVDASAVAAIIFGEPEAVEIAHYLEGESLVAPALIDFELANVALKKIRRYPEQAAHISLAVAHAEGLRIERVPVPATAALSLARQTGLSAYDAAYLWVAMSRDAALVTLDHRLARVNERLRGEP